MLVQRPGRLPVPPRALQRQRADPARPKNLYIREDRILAHLAALYALLTGTAPVAARRRRRTRRDADVCRQVSDEDVIGYLRAQQITLTYDPRTGTLQADAPKAATAVIGHAS